MTNKIQFSLNFETLKSLTALLPKPIKGQIPEFSCYKLQLFKNDASTLSSCNLNANGTAVLDNVETSEDVTLLVDFSRLSALLWKDTDGTSHFTFDPISSTLQVKGVRGNISVIVGEYSETEDLTDATEYQIPDLTDAFRFVHSDDLKRDFKNVVIQKDGIIFATNGNCLYREVIENPPTEEISISPEVYSYIYKDSVVRYCKDNEFIKFEIMTNNVTVHANNFASTLPSSISKMFPDSKATDEWFTEDLSLFLKKTSVIAGDISGLRFLKEEDGTHLRLEGKAAQMSVRVTEAECFYNDSYGIGLAILKLLGKTFTKIHFQRPTDGMAIVFSDGNGKNALVMPMKL